MHGYIFIVKGDIRKGETPEIDADELFEYMSSRWPGIDYVNDDEYGQEDMESIVEAYEEENLYPEFSHGKITVTKDSREKREKEHFMGIKEHADMLNDGVHDNWHTKRVLRDILNEMPYESYVAWKSVYDAIHAETLYSFLLHGAVLGGGANGEFEIVDVLDYHY